MPTDNKQNLVAEARASATLEHKSIESPQDILHYGNNALAILAVTVDTIKAVYNDPGTNMPKRIERMETAISHLTDIVRESAAFAEKHAADVLAAERSRVCEWRWDEKQSIWFTRCAVKTPFQGNFCPNCGKKIEVKDAK